MSLDPSLLVTKAVTFDQQSGVSLGRYTLANTILLIRAKSQAIGAGIRSICQENC